MAYAIANAAGSISFRFRTCAAVTAQLSSFSMASRNCRTAPAIACARSERLLTPAKISWYTSALSLLTMGSPPAFQLDEFRLHPQLPDGREAVHLFRPPHAQRAPPPSRDRNLQVLPGH